MQLWKIKLKLLWQPHDEQTMTTMNSLKSNQYSVCGNVRSLGIVCGKLYDLAKDFIWVLDSVTVMLSITVTLLYAHYSNLLVVKFVKRKIIDFSRTWKRLNCPIKGNNIEWVKSFRYLGVSFQHSHSWTTEQNQVTNLVKCSAVQQQLEDFLTWIKLFPLSVFLMLKPYSKYFTGSQSRLMLLTIRLSQSKQGFWGIF